MSEITPEVPATSPELLPINISGLSPTALSDWLYTMLLIRRLEIRADPLAIEGKVVSGIHTAVGEEAIAVGVIRALRPTDLVAGTHRTHHHAIAKGMPVSSIMAEFYGKATGCCGGRGGDIHLADLSIGYLGGNAMVGTGIGIGMGAALAARMRGLDQVVVAFVGDGGANTGRTWEHINLAAIWKLPLIVVCENNQYAVTTHAPDVTAGGSITRRAEGFPAIAIDGQDVAEVFRTTADAVQRARAGEGPTFIEALTYRYVGHSTGQDNSYRSSAEIDEWRQTKDPIARLKAAMQSMGWLTDSEYEGLVNRSIQDVEEAVAFAEASPWPEPAMAMSNVTGLQLNMRVNPWQEL